MRTARRNHSGFRTAMKLIKASSLTSYTKQQPNLRSPGYVAQGFVPGRDLLTVFRAAVVVFDV